MAVTLENALVVGVSSRALFDLKIENEIFETQGLDAYKAYQREHENDILAPGSAYPIIKALLSLNSHVPDRRLVEVIVVSRNSPDLGLRVFNSIQHHELDITRAAFSSGRSVADYLQAFNIDLFLSKNSVSVQAAIDMGLAGAIVYDPPEDHQVPEDEIRIAFDGDAVLFSAESERIYQEKGLKAFEQHETAKAHEPLPEGPFAKLLGMLAIVQKQFPIGEGPIRIALVTARGNPAHERVIRTLRTWNLHVDEAFFLGGIAKDEILRAFGAHIYFDDQDAHLSKTARYVPSARVPYPSGDAIRKVVEAP